MQPTPKPLTDLSGQYRNALLALGKSASTHIYELQDSYLLGVQDKEEGRFLGKLKRLYDTLTYLKKKIFLAESLEKGRVYPFWYYGLISEQSYGYCMRMLAKAWKEAV